MNSPNAASSPPDFVFPPDISPEDREKLMVEAVKMLMGQDPIAHIGPLMIGFALDLVFFGIMLVQLERWFSTYRTDRLALKLVVIFSTLAATASTCYGVAYIFRLFVQGYGKWLPFVEPTWLANYAVIGAPIIAVIQAFYADRAYRLHKRFIIIIIAVVGILAHVISAIMIRVRAGEATTLATTGDIQVEFYIWTGATLATDLFLTGTIMYGLWKIRSDFSATQKLINRLVRASFEAQVPPTLVALLLMIFYGIDPRSPRLYAVILFHAKIYVNGILAVLNSRNDIQQRVRGGSNDMADTSRPALSHPHHFYLNREGQERDGAEEQRLERKGGKSPTEVYMFSESVTEIHPMSPLPVHGRINRNSLSRESKAYQKMEDA